MFFIWNVSNRYLVITLPLTCRFSCCKVFVGDGLPAQVCERCVHQVNESFTFKLQCERSDATLRQFIRSQAMEVTG